jgi:hypothetical protein
MISDGGAAAVEILYFHVSAQGVNSGPIALGINLARVLFRINQL